MAKKKQSTTQPPLTTLGERLLAALTQQEIAQLLDAFFVALLPEQQASALNALAADTLRTVQQLLTAPPAQAAAPAPGNGIPFGAGAASLAKLAEQWSALWSEWDAVITAAADEEGKYYVQEEHWEPPYFDSYAVMEDLDAVAVKMHPLLETAFAHRFAPDMGFVEALKGAEDEIAAGMPEWIEIMDGMAAGEHLTTCLLTWDWLAHSTQSSDAYTFAERIRTVEEELAETSLEPNALIAFFTELPAADQQQLLQGMQAHYDSDLWKDLLQNVYSPWNAIYLFYIEQYAPEQYLDDLRLTIPQAWRNGLPVIEDLLQKEAYQESLMVIHETIASLVGRNQRDAAWTPTSALLLPTINRYGTQYGTPVDELTDHKRLLQTYQQTARGLGKSELVNALELQLISLDHFHDWQTIFRAFDQVTLPDQTRRALFDSWKTAVVRRADPHFWGYGYEQPTGEWWLSWLIDSIVDSTKGPVWFQSQITSWLATLPGDPKAMRAQEGRLRLLTNDLTVARNKMQNPYPKFFAVAIRPQELSTPDDKARQRYLQQFAPADLWERMIDYWQQQFHHYLPNPGQVTNGAYESHAQWLTALKELAPSRFTALLDQWRVEHHRRRNLWKALTQVGIK